MQTGPFTVGILNAAAQAAFADLGRLVFSTPDPEKDPALRGVWQIALAAAAPLAAGALALGTGRAAWTEEGWSRIRHLLVRALFTVAAMVFSLRFIQGLIALNNALIAAFLGTSALNRFLVTPPAAGLLNQLFLLLPYTVLLLLLALAYLLRLMEIYVLAALAPLLILFYLWPETAYITQGWLQEAAVLIFAQFVQALVFLLGRAEAGDFGWSGAPMALLNSLLLAFLVLRVPVLLRRLARTGAVSPFRWRLFG